jgi:hypothetical protein
MIHRFYLFSAPPSLGDNRMLPYLDVGAHGGGVGQLRAHLHIGPLPRVGRAYHAFGLIGTALSKEIGLFQSSSLRVVPISPNVS